MAGRLNLQKKIFESPGYSADVRLSDGELALFRAAITEQWLSVIAAHRPDLAPQFEAAGIANYHKLSHLVQHEALWPKQNRCLPRHRCQEIRQLPFLRTLREELGDFDVSNLYYEDVLKTGHEEIHWRLVRPDSPTDVGPLHADKWFHSFINDDVRPFPIGATTFKIWIPIYAVPGKNGLLMVPDSHVREWRYHGRPGRGGMKPCIDEDPDSLDPQLMLTDPGNMLVFNESILHGGAINRGAETRVSVEMTMVFTRH